MDFGLVVKGVIFYTGRNGSIPFLKELCRSIITCIKKNEKNKLIATTPD